MLGSTLSGSRLRWASGTATTSMPFGRIEEMEAGTLSEIVQRATEGAGYRRETGGAGS